MHGGYLGGVWAAVKFGMGAGLAALLVGLQPVLTAVWISSRGGVVSARQWAGLALGFGGLALVVWQKLGVGEISGLNFAARAGRTAEHHGRHPLPEALRGALRRAHRQAGAAVRRFRRDFAAGAARTRKHALELASWPAPWPGRCWR